MDLRQLGYVVAIAEEGGFTSAAERIGISQPSLSYAIKALENELGTLLFHRLGRTVRPTSAGEALLGPARQALRDAEVARAAVAAVNGLAAGRGGRRCARRAVRSRSPAWWDGSAVRTRASRCASTSPRTSTPWPRRSAAAPASS